MSVLKDAAAFVALLESEKLMTPEGAATRLAQIRREHRQTRTYWQTEQELIEGSKIAWRNSTECIGKYYWRQLKVHDRRHVSTAQELFTELVEHLGYANNAGRTRLLLTLFAPVKAGEQGIRIWNSQLVRYAGYLQADGSVSGDPDNLRFTQLAQLHGWRGQGTPYDILPLLLQEPGKAPQLFEIPAEAVIEIPIIHPEFEWFAELGLKWYNHPSISNMRLEIGGVSYPSAPFSAWYTVAEIAARNFAESGRYNALPAIAQRMNLDTRKDRTLWKDRALTELLRAVMHSFEQEKVSILDHHTVARQFALHEHTETEAGRIVPGNWRAFMAPTAASTTAIFNRSYQQVVLKPNFFAQGGCPFSEGALTL